jgi:hypothetical protein
MGGEEYYTRAGNFKLDRDGYIVTLTGQGFSQSLPSQRAQPA